MGSIHRHPTRPCIGVTNNLRRRLAEHDAGEQAHTAKFRPWRIVTAIAFSDDVRSEEFERHVKTGSGAERARRHLR